MKCSASLIIICSFFKLSLVFKYFMKEINIDIYNMIFHLTDDEIAREASSRWIEMSRRKTLKISYQQKI